LRREGLTPRGTLLQAGLIDLVVKRADLPSVIAYLSAI